MNIDFNYLKWHVRRRIGKKIISYHWLNDFFLPYLKECELRARNKNEKAILSDVYYMLGDFYFFLNARNLSLKAYKKSYLLDKSHLEAYLGYSNILVCMNKKLEASLFLNHLSKKFPQNQEIDDLVHELKISKEKFSPNKVYALIDFFVQGKIDLIHKRIKKSNTIKYHLNKACLYGIQKNRIGIIKEWHKISVLKGDIQIRMIDWFCIYDTIANHKVFWEILDKCKNRISPLSVWVYENLPLFLNYKEDQIGAKITNSINEKLN